MKRQLLFTPLLALAFFACTKKTDTDKTTTSSTTTTGSTVCTTPVSLSKLESISIFPTDNPLNTDISTLPVDANSNSIILSIGVVGLHADFGSGLWNGAPIGIPFSLVCGSQTKVSMTYRANSYDGNYGNESDAGPFPIPNDAKIEANGVGDSHVLVADVENKMLYEFYNTSKNGSNWEASCGAAFDLKTNTYRTDGWTSADAAGLPILPCLVRYEEVATGVIDHAIRFSLPKSLVIKGYVHPARHKVNGTGLTGFALPMGARLRLKSSFDISSYSKENQVILTAMKKYGIILADIGSSMFITGAPDSRWDDSDLQNLKKIKSSDFEVVKIGTVK